MQFHEWQTLRSRAKYTNGSRITDEADWNEYAQSFDQELKVRHLVEEKWAECARPYYSVYPVALKALTAVKLTLPASHLQLPLPTLLVRFAKGQGPRMEDYRLTALLATRLGTVHTNHPGLPGILFCVDAERDNGDRGGVNFRLPCGIPGGSGNESIEEVLAYTKDADRLVDEQRKSTGMELREDGAEQNLLTLGPVCCRLLCGISLLADDPTLIKPEVLKADELKVEQASPERLAELVEKAKRRGKYGFSIGADWEVMPHYRRPHFAIRWFGPKTGEQVAKLVPVVGAIVHRTKLSDVPTGYLDEEEVKA